jgi:MFS family permease
MRTHTPRSAVRRLALARLISITGGAAAFAALNFTVYERTGSAAWLSVSLLLTIRRRRRVRAARRRAGRPVRPPEGDDRAPTSRRRVLRAMAFVHEPWMLIAVGFVAAVVETPFWSASAAAVPNLVARTSWRGRTACCSWAETPASCSGPGPGRRAARGDRARDGVRGERVHVRRFGPDRDDGRGRFAEDRSEADAHEHRGVRAGFVFIARDRVLRTLVFAWVALVFGIGMAMVADVPLAELFGSGSTGYGLMIGAFGVGSVAGSLAARNLRERNEAKALVLGTLAMGVATAGIALSPWFAPILALLVVCGVAEAVIMVRRPQHPAAADADAVRSRVSSASESMVDIALSFGFVLGGPAVAALGPRAVYALGGAFGCVGAAVCWCRCSLRPGARPERRMSGRSSSSSTGSSRRARRGQVGG